MELVLEARPVHKFEALPLSENIYLSGNFILYRFGNSWHSRTMIKSFADKETEKIWNQESSRKLPGDIQVRAHKKLRMIHAAGALESLQVPPSNRLETLKGDRKSQWSIRINQQWRICFRWEDGDAYEVELADYH